VAQVAQVGLWDCNSGCAAFHYVGQRISVGALSLHGFDFAAFGAAIEIAKTDILPIGLGLCLVAIP
jgi:hypothetical protein